MKDLWKEERGIIAFKAVFHNSAPGEIYTDYSGLLAPAVPKNSTINLTRSALISWRIANSTTFHKKKSDIPVVAETPVKCCSFAEILFSHLQDSNPLPLIQQSKL
jgi:hypothetical protein